MEKLLLRKNGLQKNELLTNCRHDTQVNFLIQNFPVGLSFDRISNVYRIGPRIYLNNTFYYRDFWVVALKSCHPVKLVAADVIVQMLVIARINDLHLAHVSSVCRQLRYTYTYFVRKPTFALMICFLFNLHIFNSISIRRI